jgi:addiction module RelE/StbE family toxin
MVSEVRYAKSFLKQFDRLRKSEKHRVADAIEEFAKTADNPPAHLRRHALKGEWRGFESISAGGDLRIHYYLDRNIIMVCAAVGTHSTLYG